MSAAARACGGAASQALRGGLKIEVDRRDDNSVDESPMRYMLDTKMCIYLLESQPPEVVERFNALGFKAHAGLKIENWIATSPSRSSQT